MANGTLEANTMKPVGKDDRWHSFALGLLVNNDVRILCPSGGKGNQQEHQ